MDVREAYKVLQAECGIEVGDKVKISRGYEKDEAHRMGFTLTGLSEEFRGMVGKIKHVVEVADSHISLPFGHDTEIYVPFFCLELVEKGKPELLPIIIGPYEVKFLDNKIKVCDITITKGTLKQILDRLEN